MSLTADRTHYVVAEGEFPTYAVLGGEPNQSILWSLWQNGVMVLEDQPFGKVTDGEGNWFGIGSPWIAEHTGFWVVLVKTGERQASVRFMVSRDFGDPRPVPPHTMLGVTHVAGLYRFSTSHPGLTPASFLVEGARHIRNLGAQHIFAYLTPQYRIDYSFDDFGDVVYPSLAALADSPNYRELFSLPFETFVLTVYTFANWQWILSRGRRDSVPFDPDGEREELAELVRYLAAAYPGKRFILKNWEGDWQMKLSYDPNAVASAEQVVGFVEWMRARQCGVTEGRGNSNGQRVQHAIEINLVHQAQRGLPSMLGSVIPEADSDLISYSAWWSLGRRGSLARNVRDDITFIRAFPGLGNRPVIVSEFGISYVEAETGSRTTEAVEAFSAAEVPMALYWQIFDNGPDLALVGRQATRFDSWHTIRAFLRAHNDAEFVHEQTRLPHRIVAGERYPVTITVRNKGNLFDPVLGYAIGLLDTAGKLVQEIWIRREVRTEEAVTVDFELQVPSTAGVYFFRMFQHGVELFGEEMTVEVHADPASDAGKHNVGPKT